MMSRNQRGGEEMSNNKQSSVMWLYEKMYEHRGLITIEEFEQAKEMEVAGKEMSYSDGYREGYKRALELAQWTMSNLIPPHNEQR